MTFKSVFSLSVTCSLVAILFIACDDHRAFSPTAKIRMVATLSGSAGRPTPVVSQGAGTLVGDLDRATRVFSYTVTYSGITPVAGHLHRTTLANGNGPVEVPFASLGSPIIGTAMLATNTRVDSLINGFYYVNLHTAAFPGGELRGNIRVDGPNRLDAMANGAQERPTPVVTAATGTFVGVVDPATRVLSYTVTYSGLTPVAGHLHRITLANGNGPVEVPFASLASPIIGTATLTNNARVDSLLNGFYYLNLHTAANPGGEIRGDIR